MQSSPGTMLLALWRLARPEAWMVSVLPVYGGWLLASRELVPGLDVWLAFWQGAEGDGATTAGFLEAFGAWWPQAWPLLLGLVVMGPLVWTATLLINDVHDLPGDRQNPRKARSPLVQGVVGRGWARGVAYAAAGAALLAAIPVGGAFAILVAGCLALAWAYSVPPVRLKTRPGADVAVNAVGVGLWSGLAGWSIAASPGSFPLVFAPQAVLVAVAVYVPTTLVDMEADQAAGYHTIATHLGRVRTYALGWWSWVASNLGAVWLSWTDTIIPRGMLPVLLVFTPLMVGEYHAFIGRARDGPEMVKGIVLCSFTFLAVILVFALMYTGMWVA